MLFCGIATIFSCSTKQTPASKSAEVEVAEAVCNIYDHIFECYGAGNDSLDVFNRRYLTSNYNCMIDKGLDMQSFGVKIIPVGHISEVIARVLPEALSNNRKKSA